MTGGAVAGASPSASAGSFGRLVITDAGGTVREHRLDSTRTSIGRHAGNDIVILEDRAVSGRHAVLTIIDGVAVVEDFDSTNGTLINARLIPKGRHVLTDGDTVVVGRHRLRYHAPADIMDATRPAQAMAGFLVMNGASAGQRVPLERMLTRVGHPGTQVAAVTARHDGHYIAHVVGANLQTPRRPLPPPTLNGIPFGTSSVKLISGDTVVVAGITLVFEQPLRSENAAIPALAGG